MPRYTVKSALHTGLTVTSLDRAIGFFRDVLGFDVDEPIEADAAFIERLTGVVTPRGARLTFVKGPGHTFELLEYSAPAPGRGDGLRPCDPGFAHITFTVEGIDALVAACGRAGYAPYRPIVTLDDPAMRGTRVVYLRGPDNISVELIEWAKPASEI
jgi:catechol 2,3-dioxygenase-like lactoylglutathione lyase family enzyme